MRFRTKFIIFLMFSLMLTTLTSFYLYQEVNDLERVVKEQENLILNLQSKSSEELNFTCPVIEAIPVEGDLQTKSSKIVAVSGIHNSGSVGDVFIEVKGGRGRVLINTNPFIEADTQFSAKTAVEVAENYTQKSLLNKDVIVTFDMDDTVLLGGPSAGAAISAVTIAAIEDKEVRDDVIVTGTIEPSGRIGSVGGILEKAQAAYEQGTKIFLVPQGDLKIKYYERVVKRERLGFFNIQRVYYEPKELDLKEHMKEQGMEVKEVFTIEDVVENMLK